MSSVTKREFERAAKIIDRHVAAIHGPWWLEERSIRRDADHGTGQPNAILMEGCYGWTDITFDDAGEDLRAELRALGLFVEAYSGWAIHVYRI